MRFAVTPYAGVWIEIYSRRNVSVFFESLPMRECGLKYIILSHLMMEWVTPYAGVWIEILYNKSYDQSPTVTPYAGVWIEMIIRQH